MRTAKTLGLFVAAIALGVLPLKMQAAVTGGFEKTLQVSGAVDLDINTGSGDVKIHTGGNGSVHIVAKIRAQNSWLFGGAAEDRIHRIEQNPPVEQQGNTIHIGRSVDHELMQNISIDYDVTVPPQTRVDTHTGSGDQTISGLQLALSARSGSGNITVDNIGADVRAHAGSGDIKITSMKGALDVQTGSGNIHASGVAGQVTASAGSGDVEIEQTAAGNIQVNTGSGNVKLRGIQGGLRVQTGSGDIRAEGTPMGDWRVGAGSGGIELRVPANASFNLDARTNSGRLTIHRPVTMQGTFAKNHVQGKVGNGGVLLDLHTGSGDIELD